MTLNSLNSIIDDILLTLRNSNIAESESISRIQIESWIHRYRVLLLKQDLDKGRQVNPQYTQILKDVHISKIEEEDGHYEYRSDIELPKMIDLHFGTGLLSVKDSFGNMIQVGSETKMKFQKYRKYTCKDYIAYIKDNHLYVEGPKVLEYVDIELIAEYPPSLGDCFDADDTPYPVPANMIPVIKEIIFNKELNLMIQQYSDSTNNSSDDNQSNIITAANRIKK